MSDPLKDFAVKALNLTDDQFAAIVYADDKQTMKETAAEDLLRLDADRVKSLKSVAKERETELHDKGYKKAQAESLSKFELQLKEEFGVKESTAQGADLVKEIVSKIGKDAKMDDDKVKLHPLYLSLERQLKEEYIAKPEYEKTVGEFTAFKSQVEREKTLYSVKSDALKVFRSLKPVMSKDPARALNQEIDFLAKLETFDYDVQADGNHIIKIEGKRLENSQGHPVSYTDFVKSQAEKYFDFEMQGERGNAGNQYSDSTGGITVPQTEKEYRIAIAKKMVALKQAWDAKNK
jgi:hypothetical protein